MKEFFSTSDIEKIEVTILKKKPSAKSAVSKQAKYWIRENKKKQWPKVPVHSEPLRIVDLFSGCGGLSLGAAIAAAQLGKRLEIALAADVWTDALEVYKNNFNSILSQSTSDDLARMVDELGSTQLSSLGCFVADSLGRVDVIVAGPPCQGHSDLNNSSRRDDPRNLLYTIPVAFALRLLPKFLIVENVPTVVHSTGRVVGSAQQQLQAAGYSVIEYLADAQDFGLPQTRMRHVLVASRIHTIAELENRFSLIPRRDRDVGLWEFIEDLEYESEDATKLTTKRSKISPDNISRINYLFDSEVFDLPNKLRPPCHRDKEHSYVSMYGRLDARRPAQTITSGFGSMGQGRFVHPTQRRMLTAHEAARIQGFPDYFEFAPVDKITALREMIGNAVPPPVAAVILATLLSG